MFKKFVITAIFAISTAQAATFNFSYSGHHGGGYSMVSCDYAERQAEKLFETFGAKNIEVTCFGGIHPTGIITPISLRVRYTSVAMTENMRTVRETFRSESWENGCDFNSRLVRSAVRKVPNVKLVKANDACFGGSQRYEFTFSVKLPE